MHIYQTQKDIEKDIKDGVLTIDEDVTFKCSFKIEAELKVAGDIDARNIDAWDITAGGITARDITARDITAWSITAWDIIARDITAWDIIARDINARDILYYAFCCAYNSIKCVSIKAKREKYQEPICLDGKLEFKTEGNIGKKVKVKLLGGEVVEGELV